MTLSEALATIRDSLRGGHRDYTAGSIPQAIVLLSVPMILEMVMESLFAVVNIFWVASLGDQAITTVGVTESMMALVFGVAMGLSAAGTATVARRVGEKNPDGAGHAAAQTVLLGLVASALLAIPGAFFAPELLTLMSGSPSLANYGGVFTRLMFAGIPSIVMLFVINAVFRGAGDAVLAMRALWISNGINMLLDPFLIFGWGPFPEMGVNGAAIATIIGRSSGALYGAWKLFRGSGELRVQPAHWHLDFPLLRQLNSLAVPAAVQYLVPTVSWVALMRIVALSGTSAVAAYTIAIRIIIFTILPAWGLSNAAATLVGQNLGAKQPDRAHRSVMLCGIYNMIFLVGVSLAFILFPEPLIRFFTNDSRIVPIAVDCLRILSYGYAFYAWGMVLVQSFNGAGDTRTPTLINFACYWVLQIPLAYLLAQTFGFGARGSFSAVPIAECLLAFVALWIFRQGKWRAIAV